MGKLNFFSIVLFTVALTKSPTWDPACPKLMVDAGLDKQFGHAVAHRIHSLTLEDLRYYFKRDAPTDNGIPTVNFDLTPNVSRVLLNAPLSGYDTSFKTMAMRHTDEVLSKMSHKNWGIKYYSVLEKLVHAHHMSELWWGSKAYYDNFVESPPTEVVCKCVRDVNGNDVMAELELLALKIKFPGITSGNSNLPSGDNGYQSPGEKSWKNKLSPYKFSRYWITPYEFDTRSNGTGEAFMQKLRDFDFQRDEEVVVEHATKELQDNDQGMSDRLTDEEGWKAWKKACKNMDEKDNFQFGMFIYCMLNK